MPAGDRLHWFQYGPVLLHGAATGYHLNRNRRVTGQGQSYGFEQGLISIEAVPGSNDQGRRPWRDNDCSAVLSEVSSPTLFIACNRHLKMSDRVEPVMRKS